MNKLTLFLILLMIMSLIGAKCFKSEAPTTDKPVVHVHEQQVNTCSKDDDCIIFKVDCCDCNQGGKHQAIPKSQLEEQTSKLLVDCEEVVCLQMISQDPSCKQKAGCKSGKCVLQ